MLDHLRVIAAATDSTGHFRRYLVWTVCSAAGQAITALLLFPALGALLDARWATAGGWVSAVCLATAAVWLLDRVAAGAGLELGLAAVRAVETCGPAAVRNLPLDELQGRRRQRLRETLSTTVAHSTSSVVLILTPVVVAVVYPVVLAVGLAWQVSWQVAVTSVAVALLLGGALAWQMRTQEAAEETHDAAVRDLDDRLFEFAWLQPTLRTAGRTTDAESLVEAEITGARTATRRLLGRQIPGELAFSVAVQLGLGAMAAATWFTWQSGAVSGVTAAVLVVVLLRVVEQFTAVDHLSVPLLAMRRGLGEVRELVDLADTPPQLPAPVTALVEVSGLDSGIVRGAEFTLEPGSVTVIIGRSGSGKTTLLHTLAGLRSPESGTIRVNGEDTTTARRQRLCAVVHQDVALRDASIAENILVAAPAPTPQLLEDVLDRAQLARLVRALPDGVDTPVGELGTALSRGELHRVGLARALAAQRPLLLVDEVTSALDTLTESALVEALAGVTDRPTTVIVTHRPAALRIADQVLVMEHGRIIRRDVGPDLGPDLAARSDGAPDAQPRPTAASAAAREGEAGHRTGPSHP